ncbi:MAG: hypothetical protein KAX39_05110 [candidate division Zixibacteria bacterium]|nr:hypothetical protein [candidate division Zixibacteria bacterium]
MPATKRGAWPVSQHISIPWDHIFQTVFSFFKLLLGWFSQLSQQVGADLGMWGQLGLYLLVVLLGCWILYQLFRVLTFILLRILLPVSIVALTLFLLVILTS